MIVTFINNGGAEAFSLETEMISSDPYFALNSSTYSLGNLPSGEEVQAVFSVSATANAPLRHEALINWNMTSAVSYSTSGEFSQFISQVPVFFEEYFNYFPPLSWQMIGNGWLSNPANLAGGQPPEIAVVYIPPIYSEQKLISAPMNTQGSMELELEFKHTLLENIRSYIVAIETTSNGENWTTLWEASGNIPATTENISITGGDVGSTDFQFSFVLRGTENIALAWVFDDVILNSVDVEPHGFIVGDVVLNGGNGNVENVVVSAGGISRHPDVNGHYCLPVPMGVYDITASLAGYVTISVENMSVGLWETVVVDLILDELTSADPPQNLSATTYYNNVTLNWEIPGSEQITKEEEAGNKIKQSIQKNIISRNERSFIVYRVYRNDEVIHEISYLHITSYQDFALPQGDYNYYITAVYSDGESDPSNSALVNIVLAPPQNLTYLVNSGNIVLLQWDTPPGDETRNITGFRVYRDDVMLSEVVVEFYVDLNVPVGSHSYYIIALYGEYESEPSNIVEVEITSADNDLLPIETNLETNYPNPFNPQTIISFSVAQTSSFVTLDVYNLRGQKIRTLVKEMKYPGYYQVVWDGTDDTKKHVASGLYFYRMKTPDYQNMKKMILLK